MSEAKKRILVVEDDAAVGATICDILKSAGLMATLVASGAAAAAELKAASYAVCMVDLGLPDIDGMDLVKELGLHHTLGIMIVTGRSDRLDRVMGLELGADDFIAKPFDSRELVARVKSLMRRLEHTRATAQETSAIKVFPTWTFDRDARAVHRAGEPGVGLTPSEYRLLAILVDHPDRVLSRAFILDKIYGNADAPFDRSVDITVTRLRHKIEADPKQPRYIKTIHSEGYLFVTDGAAHHTRAVPLDRPIIRRIG